MMPLPPTALYTETAPPLPIPPSYLVNKPYIQHPVRSLASAIKVETPFDVDMFEYFLSKHPNRPFVRSVMVGLRFGFWPSDDGDWESEVGEMIEDYPSKTNLKAMRAFRDEEVAAGRWSQAIPHKKLRPGMEVSPISIAWENHEPRFSTYHTEFGLEKWVPKSWGNFEFDDMDTFGQALRDARLRYPYRDIVIFKSKVALDFLNLPAHPVWQSRQIFTVDGCKYVGRRLLFGSRGSVRCWHAVSGLLCWIAARMFHADLHVYMDDFFGCDFADNMDMFHGLLRPRNQVKLLQIWELLECPFDDVKHEHGEQIEILGFWVNTIQGTITLQPHSIADIRDEISSFLSAPYKQPALCEWQRLAGRLKWLLKVLPWGKPALSELLRTISENEYSSYAVISAIVKSDLRWLKFSIPKYIGIRFDREIWTDQPADFVVWTDASLKLALSYFFEGRGFVYQLQANRSPTAENSVDIFFLELVAILSAVHYAASLPCPPRRLLVWSDSSSSVNAINSLRASKHLHNAPVFAIAKIIMQSGIDLRVRHIPGRLNTYADMLSRLRLVKFQNIFPSNRSINFFFSTETTATSSMEAFLLNPA